jgi:hypothetical protein
MAFPNFSCFVFALVVLGEVERDGSLLFLEDVCFLLFKDPHPNHTGHE